MADPGAGPDLRLPRRLGTGRNDWFLPARPAEGIKVVHGADDELLAGFVVGTVGQARRTLAAPFDIPGAATAFINGVPAQPADRLRPDDHLEFILPHGRKGINRMLAWRQIEQEYGLPSRLLEELFRHVAPADIGDDGSPLYLVSVVDGWLAGRFADVPVETARPAPDDPFMTIRAVSLLLACSYTEARERLLDGRIRAVKDGRWMRTRRSWVEEYVAGKTVQPQPGVGAKPAPAPARRRKGGAKVNPVGVGRRFLEKLAGRDA